MTRTYLCQVAYQIRRSPIESFNDSTYFGTVYTGLFIKKPIHCFFDTDNRLLAIFYRGITYCVNPTNKRGAIAIRKLHESFTNYQKVMLYPNESHLLFEDTLGTCRSKEWANYSQSIDYKDLIPIPNPSV